MSRNSPTIKPPRFLVLLALSAGLVIASGQSSLRLDSQPGSRMRIDGTSTIHDWHAESQLIGGFMELDPSFPFTALDKAKAGTISAKAETFIAVRSLKSSSGKAMDSVMQEAMKEKEHPRILFKLSELTLKELPKAGGAALLEAKGTLTVAGVTKEITMPVSLAATDGSKVKFTGKAAMKMTDFGIKPPSPAVSLGLIKTGDDVKLTFEWVVAPKPAGK